MQPAPFNKVYRGYKSPVVRKTNGAWVEQGGVDLKYKYAPKVRRDAKYYRELLDREWYAKNSLAMPGSAAKSPKHKQKNLVVPFNKKHDNQASSTST